MGKTAVEESDRILMARLVRADEEAFTQFFDLVYDPLERLARTRSGSEAAREQSIRVAMTDAVRHLDQWRNQAPVVAWLTTIFENQSSPGPGGADGAPLDPQRRENIRKAVHEEWQDVTTRRAQKRVLTSAIFAVVLAAVIMIFNCPGG